MKITANVGTLINKVKITDGFGVALVRIHEIERVFALADQIRHAVECQDLGAICKEMKEKETQSVSSSKKENCRSLSGDRASWKTFLSLRREICKVAATPSTSSRCVFDVITRGISYKLLFFFKYEERKKEENTRHKLPPRNAVSL